MPRRYSRELRLQIFLTEVPLECQNLDRAKDRFDRARKQEPVQIFAKAEDSRDPAVVYAQVRWSCIHERFDLKFIMMCFGKKDGKIY